uniref:Uncharacterized protein n=1 Tax=Euplotes crassus TaxID=5936 RepID=A0A7S3NXU7_EUPCR|mmetsp:Transcript_31283/g.30812  ORF Transcript_31283/g.30812 Transcript_31283/m.30812 type:complete len:138 (+) Transcript_31283:130-543(+)
MINMNMNTTNDATSQIEEKSVRLSAHMPGNMMRNPMDNYEIQQELKRHTSQNRRIDNNIDDKESKLLKQKMSQLYSKIIQRNYEIDAVKYANKKLDKRISYYRQKALKMSKALKTLSDEHSMLKQKEMNLIIEKALN